MEAKFRGKAHEFYGPVAASDMKMKAVGKRSLEWDLNDWKWDGDLFVATQLNSLPSDCRSRQFFPLESSEIPNQDLSSSSLSCSDEINLEGDRGKREAEKRRRSVAYEVEDLNDEAGSLNLKLGGQVNPIMEAELERWEVKSGKKTKLVGASSNRAVCQVDDCKADLSNAKDYHRRHKVCDVHSKESKALVGNVMQRFCQQCSRFHVLQEFDEGKRSCRRRLAGHNRRRRKTHPDTPVNGGSQDDEKGSSYLLISLLRILSNMQSSGSDDTKDQDLLSHLLRNLASIAGTINVGNPSGLLQGSQDMLNAATNVGIQEKVSNLISNGTETTRPFGSASKRLECTNLQEPQRPMGQCVKESASELARDRIVTNDARASTTQTLSGLQFSSLFYTRDDLAAKINAQETTTGRKKLNNIDLNNISNDSQDCLENVERCHAPVNPNAGSLNYPLWLKKELQKTSPPYTGANSDSTSARSLSSTSEEAQVRTDRIVFKLFGKDPNNFPVVLRSQILNWLSHSPTDIESYIRPGCIILTIYLRMQKSAWEELCCDLGSSLSRLLDASNDSFWRSGWVYTRVRHHVAFIYNGQVVLDTPLPFKSRKNCRISSISPIAVPVSERVQFVVKGYNLSRSTTRLLCALEGKYLFQETCYNLMDGAETFIEHDDLQCLSFPCSIPNVAGRGFIEVEDHGLSSSFLPFIVAEQDVCSEICMLESVIESADTDGDIRGGAEKMEAKNQAHDFIHEMGWLLHRNHLKFRLGDMDPNLDLFPFNRLKGLMEFAMDHDWCAVVNKLLDIMFSGSVDAGELPIELSLMEMCLLHKAVQRNCRPMVELLLRYSPDKKLGKPGSGLKKLVNLGPSCFLFRPDVVGPAGLTPLHIVASTVDSDNLLDALTDDPELVGIEAWKRSRDSTGLTPYDYACLQGHYSYVQLVQKKIKQKSESGHVVVDIPGALLDCNIKQKLSDELKSTKVAGLQTEKIEARAAIQGQCKLCERKLLAYGRTGTLLTYRPSILSMVGIAAVCVCVALLFKSSPEVLYIFQPFCWDQLKYGSS